MPQVYSSTPSAFYQTLQLYRDYIGYKKDYTYLQWKRLPKDHRAAALFVQFYDQITLAWWKVKTDWSIEEEAVETVNQYLHKNVEKILKDKKRFTPAYIYRVAYNCLYCLCIDPTKNKDRYYKETSETFATPDGEVSWFDFIPDTSTEEVSEIIEHMDKLPEEVQMYIACQLGEVSEYRMVCFAKKKGLVDFNLRDSDKRSEFVERFTKYCKNKFVEHMKRYPAAVESMVKYLRAFA